MTAVGSVRATRTNPRERESLCRSDGQMMADLLVKAIAGGHAVSRTAQFPIAAVLIVRMPALALMLRLAPLGCYVVG